ncbi:MULTISPECIES: hypothetical protein [unclassified Gemella]|uniref:hypothetical protein n=1 Tax=unclassified Gemella TaxID=2624949 RepID=UPI001C05CEA9|nr:MULTISPECIES: hypothetical protein [unclassified Gemella]MBU0278509.1 hypothetical protein [Gemella sp. zg-1178]QWQ39454.1 hypothetical protein KMP11_03780 [Gemella sp. zg-570]
MNNIIDNVKIDSLTKLDFETKEQKMIFHINEDLINEDDFKNLLSTFNIKGNY